MEDLPYRGALLETWPHRADAEGEGRVHAKEMERVLQKLGIEPGLKCACSHSALAHVIWDEFYRPASVLRCYSCFCEKFVWPAAQACLAGSSAPTSGKVSP